MQSAIWLKPNYKHFASHVTVRHRNSWKSMKRNGVRVSCSTLANLFLLQLMTVHFKSVFGVRCFKVFLSICPLISAPCSSTSLNTSFKKKLLVDIFHTATATQNVSGQSLMSTVAMTLQYLVYSRSNFQWYAGKPLDSANQGCTCTSYELPWDGLTMASVWLLPHKSFNRKTTHTNTYSK